MGTLKDRTAAEHAAVERRVDFDRLTSSRDAYRRTLEAFFGFYEPIERRLASAPLRGFDFAPEPKAPRLASDLAVLGISDLARLPRCDRLPTLDSLPRSVGILYVLEGAALGGRIISRRSKERLGIDETTGGSFFHGAGEQTGTRWRLFGRAAEASIPGVDFDDAVAAARDTFTAFEEWLAWCDERNDRGAR